MNNIITSSPSTKIDTRKGVLDVKRAFKSLPNCFGMAA